MDFDIPVSAGQSVLLIHSGLDVFETKETSSYFNKLSSCVGSTGAVQIVALSKLDAVSTSSYDGVFIADPIQFCTVDLPTVLRTLRPDGVLWIPHLTVQSDTQSGSAASSIISALTLGGFVKPHAEVHANSSLAPENSVANLVFRVHAYKPSYEVGASVPIKLPAKKAAAAAWTLAATDIVDDLDIIDSDTVLDDDDLKKPDPDSLRACGASDGPVKRKACKNCTCGLAEELNAQNDEQQSAKTSSCGNCYLGDAFRCASCPYRGMPAFKPGEKVQLPELMQDDI